MKILSFSGNATRLEFVVNTIATSTIGILALGLGFGVSLVGSAGASLVAPPIFVFILALIVVVLAFISNVGVHVRRLQDLGWSCWWMVAIVIAYGFVIPGIIIFLILSLKGSGKTEEEYREERIAEAVEVDRRIKEQSKGQ